MGARDWPALGRPGRRPPAALATLGVAGSPGGERVQKAWALRPWCACVGWGPQIQL